MKWSPVRRHDGTWGYVNAETGEIHATIMEALGYWNLDGELNGLLAESEAADPDSA